MYYQCRIPAVRGRGSLLLRVKNINRPKNPALWSRRCIVETEQKMQAYYWKVIDSVPRENWRREKQLLLNSSLVISKCSSGLPINRRCFLQEDLIFAKNVINVQLICKWWFNYKLMVDDRSQEAPNYVCEPLWYRMTINEHWFDVFTNYGY